MWLWAAVAFGADVLVVPMDVDIRPGVQTTLLVSAWDENGAVEPPRMTVAGGVLAPADVAVPDGVTAWSWLPPKRPGPVELRVGTDLTTLNVRLPQAVPWTLPVQVDGVVGRSTTLRIEGDDLPQPDELGIELAEGRVIGVEAKKGGLEVVLEPGPAEYARFVPIGVRDLRTDEAPAFTRVRLRARAAVALDTEPGTRATFDVGGRIYGPVVAGDDGVVRATVDQYPGETTVKALLEDDLGNETVGSLPLRTRAESRLLAVVAGSLAPGVPAPLFYLHGIRSDGRAWDGGAPFCRTPGAKEISLATVSPGVWATTVPVENQRESLESRFVCSLPDGVEASVRVPANIDVPSRLRLNVWPADMSSDRPVAEIAAALENARGERLPGSHIDLSADLGQIRTQPAGGFVVEGEYNGEAAVEKGSDVVLARWDPPGGLGRVRDLQIGWGTIESGALEVFVRAIDDAGLPRVGADVEIAQGDETLKLRTNGEGWASTFVPWTADEGPRVLSARSGGVQRNVIRVPDAAAWRGPGTALLAAEMKVHISPGRIATIRTSVEPPVLYTGPRSVATVFFEVLDRSGQPVSDVELQVEASEGALGEVVRGQDGRYRVEFRPDGGERSREVQITARAEGAAASATLLLEPRPVDRAVSLSGGLHSNFRRVNSPLLALDVDSRLPFFNRSMLLRVGVGFYGHTENVETDIDDPVRVSLTVLPVTLALVARREAGGRGVWLGLGGVVASYAISASYGAERFGTGIGVLTPGPTLLVGAGQRFSGGELMAEARFTALVGPAGDISVSKQVGGLGILVGYRVIY
ncbi:MAG: hypothetical protein KC912_01380 [Proteobacteria bacterium]|nr:hypothetical protein [Pseudomonadota bacterium]